MILFLALHVLAAVVWVGGMFFAYLVLRPAAGPLEPAQRLPLWGRVFGRFLPWVWAAVAALLVTGYGMVFLFLGGFRGAGVHVHVMQATGILMMLLFFHLFFAPWRRFQAAVGRGALPDAAKNLEQIRTIVLANLVLGLITIVVGATGRWWG
jgi:uncharacterized membrane protein